MPVRPESPNPENLPSARLAPARAGADEMVLGSERRSALRDPIRQLMGSRDYEATLATLAGIALPDAGAWSIVDLLEPPGWIRRLAVVHADPAMQQLARRLQDGWPPDKKDPLGAPAVMSTRTPQIVAHVTDEMLVNVARNEENLAILRELGIGSFLVVPLVGREEVLGAITFVTAATGHQYTERDVMAAEDLAALCSLTIEHARLYRDAEEARRIADETSAQTLRQKRDLEQVMEIQTRLVRGFSHDVKNPLGAAQGYAYLLEAGVIDTLTVAQRNSVVRIRSNIRSALQLIDDLIEYARNKTGKLEIRSEPVGVGELAQEIADEYRAQIESKGLELEVHVGPEIPPVQSDRMRIRQILGNLLSNAVKYTDQGRVTVRVQLRRPSETPERGGWIVASVADTGPGISQEDHALVFQEFARLEPVNTQGTGLGLAISQWIAEALGARITLESERGHGATFAVWLPLAPDEQMVSAPVE